MAALKRRNLLLFDEPVDVLEHDNSVIDHDADHQGEGEHSDLIQGETHGRHQRERRDDRCRDRNRRDQSGADIREKEEDNH